MPPQLAVARHVFGTEWYGDREGDVRRAYAIRLGMPPKIGRGDSEKEARSRP